jgi:hypothetical protein
VPGGFFSFVQQSAKSGARIHFNAVARGPSCHAANPTESRNRCIDCRKAAIWFQLGMLGDANAFVTVKISRLSGAEGPAQRPAPVRKVMKRDQLSYHHTSHIKPSFDRARRNSSVVTRRTISDRSSAGGHGNGISGTSDALSMVDRYPATSAALRTPSSANESR